MVSDHVSVRVMVGCGARGSRLGSCRCWLECILQVVPEFLPILRRETMPDRDHNPLERRDAESSVGTCERTEEGETEGDGVERETLDAGDEGRLRECPATARIPHVTHTLRQIPCLQRNQSAGSTMRIQFGRSPRSSEPTKGR